MSGWLLQTDDTAVTGVNDDGDSIESRRVTYIKPGLSSVQDAIDDANFPFILNQQYPLVSNSRMKARVARVRATGFKVYAVDIEYSIPSRGDEHTDESLSNPLVYNVQTVQESHAIDRDRIGNGILSSASRSISGIFKTRNYKRVVITRWESSYNAREASLKEEAVNIDSFEGSNPGEVKVVSIDPNQSFTLNTLLMPIDYTFDFKPAQIWGEDPWQTVIVDRDSFGLVGGKVHRFVDAGGDPMTGVLLDGKGRPIDSSVTYIDETTNEPSPNPSWDQRPTPSGATVLGGSNMKFLKYDTVRPINFTSEFGF